MSKDSEADYSGRILLRIPKSLHASLVEAAAHEGVSLNQFTAAALASAVNWRSTPGESAARRREQGRREAAELARRHGALVDLDREAVSGL